MDGREVHESVQYAFSIIPDSFDLRSRYRSEINQEINQIGIDLQLNPYQVSGECVLGGVEGNAWRLRGGHKMLIESAGKHKRPFMLVESAGTHKHPFTLVESAGKHE